MNNDVDGVSLIVNTDSFVRYFINEELSSTTIFIDVDTLQRIVDDDEVRNETQTLLKQIASEIEKSNVERAAIIRVRKERYFMPTLVGVLLQYRHVYCRKSTVEDMHSASLLSDDCTVDVVQVSLFGEPFVSSTKSDGVKWIEQHREQHRIQRDISLSGAGSSAASDDGVVVWNWSMPTNFCENDDDSFVESIAKQFSEFVQHSSTTTTTTSSSLGSASKVEFSAIRVLIIKSINGSFNL